MAQFLAMTSRGLHSVLKHELMALGLKVLRQDFVGVWFESSWAGCYRANLCLYSATRVVKPLLDFPAYQNEDLYHNVKKHDFTKYIEPTGEVMVDAHVRESSFKDRRFVALKVKDAIVDQFRENFGVRPSVNKQAAGLRVIVRVVKNQVSLSLDTSGESLAFRGYRKVAGRTPLREHLAAGLLKVSGWQLEMPLVDPMCGSGTFLIEAALMARQMAPGSFRRSFAFQSLKGFDKKAWDRVVQEVMDREDQGEMTPRLYGFDISGRAINFSYKNATEAGVERDIVFQKRPVSLLENPLKSEELGAGKKGILVVNPPYGERLGESLHEVMDVYRDLAFTLKRQFKGWDCWLLSGNSELTKYLKLKSSEKHSVYNGPLECRFLKYEIR